MTTLKRLLQDIRSEAVAVRQEKTQQEYQACLDFLMSLVVPTLKEGAKKGDTSAVFATTWDASTCTEVLIKNGAHDILVVTASGYGRLHFALKGV